MTVGRRLGHPPDAGAGEDTLSGSVKADTCTRYSGDNKKGQEGELFLRPPAHQTSPISLFLSLPTTERKTVTAEGAATRGSAGTYRVMSIDNDPSAGSPTETLLRLLLPLNAQVWESSQTQPRRESQEVQSQYLTKTCLLYTSPSPRDLSTSRMPSSA